MSAVLATSASRPLKARMLNRLLGAEGWTQRDALASGLSTCPMAIDDALADLITDDSAEYKLGVGYRLKGTVLCREAMRILKRSKGKTRRAIKAVYQSELLRIGVAEHREGFGLVMYELEIPAEPFGDGVNWQKQLHSIMDSTTKGLRRV